MSNTDRTMSLSAFDIVKKSTRVVVKHPQILLYPYTALLFISITYPLISATFVANWYNRIFSEAGDIAPHKLTIVIGFVGFYAFYTAFVSAYFTTAVSAGVLATLDGKKPSPFFGFKEVLRHFSRVTKFAILAVFLFPAGIYAQRKKPAKDIGWVIGSSLTLHMAQIAPAILHGKEKYGETIRHSFEILGKSWKQGLILKIYMYTLIFTIFVLPKLIHHNWYKSQTLNNIDWIKSLVIGASGFVFFKVLNAIFTTVMYYEGTANERS